MYPRIAGPQSLTPLSADSRCLFNFDCADTRVNGATGTLHAITEHEGVFTRGAHTLAATDATAVAYTAQYAQPAWSSRAWPPLGDLAPQPALGIEMGLFDALTFPTRMPWQFHRGVFAAIETGARVIAGATLFAITTAAGTGAGLWLDTTGTYYRLTLTDGTNTITATLASGASVAGDRLLFDWQYDDDGTLRLNLVVGKTVPTNRAVSSTVLLTMPTTTASDLAVRINARSASANNAQQWFRRCKIVAGNPDPITLQGIR